MSQALLSVRGLSIDVRRGRDYQAVVMDVGFDLHHGELLGLAGESGSGKSLTALALMGLISGPAARVSDGRVCLDGRQLDLTGTAGRRALRGRDIAMVFQDPSTALDPVFRVGSQLRRAIRNCGKFPRGSEREHALAALGQVGFREPEAVFAAYPHELSGGMRQRVLIAMALAVRPRVLLADEPTTALDVLTRTQVLSSLQRARSEHGMGIVLISHDLVMLAHRADRVMVMYAGRIVEEGPASDLSRCPLHPYTKALMAAVPHLDGRPVCAIPGQPPVRPGQLQACAFAPRCPRADATCLTSPPQLRAFDGRQVSCHHLP